jgi:hypothetical protein
MAFSGRSLALSRPRAISQLLVLAGPSDRVFEIQGRELVSRDEHDTFLIDEGPTGRRHLRAVPAFLRGAGRNGCERPGRRRRARRARNGSVDDRARRDPHRGRDRSCRGISVRPMRYPSERPTNTTSWPERAIAWWAALIRFAASTCS